MRTTPVSATEVDAWMTVLTRRGILHATVAAPDGGWLVQATLASPVLVFPDHDAALSFVAGLQAGARTRSEWPQ